MSRLAFWQLAGSLRAMKPARRRRLAASRRELRLQRLISSLHICVPPRQLRVLSGSFGLVLPRWGLLLARGPGSSEGTVLSRGQEVTSCLD